MSLPEILLWNLLRKAPDGVVFRRQHSFDEFVVVDFYCAKAKLCIEIDGIVHDMGNQPTQDEDRNAFLAGLGMEVMHIPAAEVLKSPLNVADALVRYCKR